MTEWQWDGTITVTGGMIALIGFWVGVKYRRTGMVIMGVGIVAMIFEPFITAALI